MFSAQTSSRATWLTASLLATLAHLAIWQWYQGSPPSTSPVVAPAMVEVSLETRSAPTQASPTPPTTTTPPQQSALAPASAQVAEEPSAPTPTPAIATAMEPSAPATSPAHVPAPAQTMNAPDTPAPIQTAAAPATPITTRPTAEPALVPARYSGPGLNNPKASYPLMAKKRGLEGTVVLRAEILPDGRCGQISVKKTSGYEILDQAALQAVAKWHFTPAKRGEQAVAGWVEIPIEFKFTD